MTRIEQDATASDDLLTKSWTDEVPRVIRSHRAPRSTQVRKAFLTLALAFLAGTLSAVGLSQRDTTPTDAVAWVGNSDEQAVALADLEPMILEDPTPHRAETPPASRSQRRPSASASASAPRWAAPLVGKLRVTGCFGDDRGDHNHAGLDLDGETGDLVRSVGAGKVVQAGYRFSGAGLTVAVQHGDTLVLYAHLSATSVKVGALVKARQKVGELGSTGHSTGSHLHFGVAKTTTLGKFWDRVINPVTWLEARGIAVPGRC